MIVPKSLKDLRRQQPEEILAFVYTTMFDIEERLLAALPTMAEAVTTSGKQASYSPTVTFRKGKNGAIKVTVAARVRLPDEEKQFMFKIGAAGQLELYREEDPDQDPVARKAEMEAEAFGDLDDVPDEPEPLTTDPETGEAAFTPGREPSTADDAPLSFAPAPKIRTAPQPSGPLTPAQERMAAIREQNLRLAREGRLTEEQMAAAKITPEDLAASA
jgi:hypothetical protein